MHIEGAVAADAKVDAGRLDQRFDRRLDQSGQRWRRSRGDPVREPVALIAIEDSEALQKRDRLRLVAGLVRTTLLVQRHEAVGIDDGRAALALADVTAERQRLAKRQPALACEAAFNHGAPEDQNIHTAVLAAGRCVLRHRQRRLRRRRPPGLHPGHTAGFELGDDLVSDFVVEVRPVLAGARPISMSGHLKVSATGAAGLSCGLPTRHGKPSVHSASPAPTSAAGTVSRKIADLVAGSGSGMEAYAALGISVLMPSAR